LECKFLEYSFSWNDSFIGTKVLGTFALKERKFYGSECSMERKFLEHSLPRSESSKERLFHGTKVPRERKFSLWTFRSPTVSRKPVAKCKIQTRVQQLLIAKPDIR